MAKNALIAILLVALAVLGGVAWRAQHRAARADREAGLASARVLGAAFDRTAALQVARLQGEVLARAQATSGFGMFGNVQVTRAPYAVLYTVDLRRVTAASYRWDARDRTMVVTVPEVTVGAPTVDMARARVAQTGVFISRTAGQAMQRDAATRLALAAGARARRPDTVKQAREASRAAVAALVRAPLIAAGLGDVRVTVRVAGEERPPGLDAERWDLTRPLDEVLGRR